jgi:hypothetical protein
MKIVSTAATANRNRENRDRPSSNAVWPCFSARPAAICPNAVPHARRHHHAGPRALMHDRPHERAPRLVLRLAASRGGRRLGHRQRLTSQHALVALQLIGPQQPQVGRDQIAQAQRCHVSGNKVHGRNPARLPVPADLGFLPDLGAEGSHRDLGPVLVEEAQADAEGDDHRDDQRVRTAPGQPRDKRRAEQENQDRVPDLAEHHGRHAHPVRAEHIGPELLQPPGGLRGRQAVRAGSQPGQHLSARQARGLCQAQLARRGARDRDHAASIAASIPAGPGPLVSSGPVMVVGAPAADASPARPRRG